MASVAVRIGTRGSALAMAQARLVAAALATAGRRAELVVIQTAGDRRAPDTAWGEGAFVGAIEEALLEGRVDLGVHSAKDLPTDEDPRLRIVAFLPRAEPRDALVAAAGRPATLDSLPRGASIGTDSPRRTGFLRARRPDLVMRPIHGNVDTRLRRLDDGAADALVLAVAGLQRLARSDRIGELLPAEIVPPAPGQGALAIQARAGDSHMAELGALVDDAATRVAVEAERAFLAATGGGCRAPVGALATLTGTQLHILAGFATVDGRFSAIEEASGPPTDHQALAEDLAARLVARRAELPNAPRVLITRPRGASRRLAGRLVEHGLAPLVVPAIEIEPLDVATELATAIDAQPVGGWAVVTSANGAAAVASAAAAGAELQRPRWAAVGRATARALREAGAPAAWLPSQHNAAALADELPIEDGTAVLLVRGDLAEATLPHRLAARGATLSEVVAYRTVEAPASSRALLEAVLAGREPAAVVFSSPSAVRGALALADERWRAQLLALPAICSGPTTAAAARAAGFGNIVEAAAPDADALAELVAQTIALAAGRAR